MLNFNPSIDECNEAIDWIEEWIENNQTTFPEVAAKLKIRLRNTDDDPLELYIGLVWFGHEAPDDSYLIPPPGWYMYQWYRDEENGHAVWKIALNNSP